MRLSHMKQQMATASVEPNLVHGFLKYPTDRDCSLKTATTWINGKRADDGYGNLWRIHNSLYDLTEFIHQHPGGSDWIEVTRGSDITEIFEASHLNPSVKTVLSKYFRRPAFGPRNSPYTLASDGFYLTLKRRVYSVIKSANLEQFDPEVIRIQNSLLIALVTTFILCGILHSYSLAVICGIVLGMNVNCAHNFFHQRNNWRMYIWDLSLLSSYEWRITHGMSHHIYPNTIYDFELLDFEPFFDFKVHSAKNFFQRFTAIFYCHFLFPLFFPQEFVKRIISICKGYQKFRLENTLPVIEFLILIGLSDHVMTALKLWLIIHCASSYYFGFVGLVSAHHHPDIYHTGDDFKYGRDWGLCQLDAVRGRVDIDGNLFLELISYGNHVLHHLFPTLDHGKLKLAEDVFRQTCREFEINDYVDKKSPSQWELLKGTLLQLSRVKPRKWKL